MTSGREGQMTSRREGSHDLREERVTGPMGT